MTKSVCKFGIGDLVKTSRLRAQQGELSLTAYAPDRRLCVVTAITEYLERTKVLRTTKTGLFIRYTKPHTRVSGDTLARWIRMTLARARVDINLSTPHRTRAASTSTAFKAAVQTILKTARWHWESQPLQSTTKSLWQTHPALE